MDMRLQKWQHDRNTVDEAENTVYEFSPQTTEENITSQEPAETEEEPQEEETEPDKSSFPEIDNSFDDVLFIGDSRTDGLSEYGHLGNADVFADSGLSAYTAMTKKLREMCIRDRSNYGRRRGNPFLALKPSGNAETDAEFKR